MDEVYSEGSPDNVDVDRVEERASDIDHLQPPEIYGHTRRPGGGVNKIHGDL